MFNSFSEFDLRSSRYQRNSILIIKTAITNKIIYLYLLQLRIIYEMKKTKLGEFEEL
ncbi:MAG: hypothetical protein ACI9GZ_002048, partial [Bacteroidia bacterium]